MVTNRPRGLAVAGLALLVSVPSEAQEPTTEALEHFESKIRPVLVERCYQCHGADSERVWGGLVLVDAEGVRTGGDSGEVVVPGAPDESLLIQAIRYDGPIRMPPDGRLSADVVADFERWVASVARPTPACPTSPIVAHALGRGPSEYDFGPGPRALGVPGDGATGAPRGHRRVVDPDVPSIGSSCHGSRPQGLQSGGAGRASGQLLRRVTFDLTGSGRRRPTRLPPSWPTPSPAPTRGWSTGSWPRPATASAGDATGSTWPATPTRTGSTRTSRIRNAFRYRDWVIEAFNDDKPYDEFVQRADCR